MEAIRFISTYFNFKFRWVKFTLVIVSSLFIVGDIVYIALNYLGQNLDSHDLRNAIAQVISHVFMLIIILIWVYSAPRFKQGHEDLEEYLYVLTGTI